MLLASILISGLEAFKETNFSNGESQLSNMEHIVGTYIYVRALKHVYESAKRCFLFFFERVVLN